jgi:hypothetical protein
MDSIMSVYYEPAFGLDKFRKPLVYEDWEAVAKAILIVLFGKEGFYPSIPALGMHIQDYTYRKFSDIDTDFLQAQLTYQLSIVSPLFSSGDLKFVKTRLAGDDSPVLLITMPIYRKKEKNTIAITIVANDDAITYNYALVSASVISDF